MNVCYYRIPTARMPPHSDSSLVSDSVYNDSSQPEITPSSLRDNSDDDAALSEENRIFSSLDLERRSSFLEYIVSHPFIKNGSKGIRRSALQKFLDDVRMQASTVGMDDAATCRLMRYLRKTYREVFWGKIGDGGLDSDASAFVSQEMDDLGEEQPMERLNKNKKRRHKHSKVVTEGQKGSKRTLRQNHRDPRTSILQNDNIPTEQGSEGIAAIANQDLAENHLDPDFESVIKFTQQVMSEGKAANPQRDRIEMAPSFHCEAIMLRSMGIKSLYGSSDYTKGAGKRKARRSKSKLHDFSSVNASKEPLDSVGERKSAAKPKSHQKRKRQTASKIELSGHLCSTKVDDIASPLRVLGQNEQGAACNRVHRADQLVKCVDDAVANQTDYQLLLDAGDTSGPRVNSLALDESGFHTPVIRRV
jgi:hypothetical protein